MLYIMLGDKLNRYLFAFLGLTTIGFLYNRYEEKNRSSEEEETYNSIRNYLLNDSSLAKSKKPIMWLHVPYRTNARKWSDFGSRNTTNLNQPYLSLCVKSIIDKCGKDFHICLIDDDSFANLIPDWLTDMSRIPEPLSTYMRNIGMCKLVYYYGGMVMPIQTICMKNMKSLYDSMTGLNKPFFIENHTTTMNVSQQVTMFPSYEMFGALKNNQTMKKIIGIQEENLSRDATSETLFIGQLERFLFEMSQKGEISMVDGRIIGIKDANNEPIGIEDLFSQEKNGIMLHSNHVCMILPSEQILKRNKYEWFASLNVSQVLEGNYYLANQLKKQV
jgi:hypothetical protein